MRGRIPGTGLGGVQFKLDSGYEQFAGDCGRDSSSTGAVEESLSGLAKTRKAEGRVDVLAERLIEQAVGHVKNPLLADLFAATRPGVKQLLKETVGPRTKRGRQIAENLFAAKEAVDRVKQSRAERGARV